ncbi:hypothetical protein Ahy_B04g070219 isoform C [Arachis hypogaea]|uniref:Uncharacterized protein n=1 Tax=Arachis hypogaea TaxID=3818 RepID=A0A444ZFR5_ARAHY|nr:hypothetical protein Ahy_B04g070219 isoform C [Arachis hypogaea]
MNATTLTLPLPLPLPPLLASRAFNQRATLSFSLSHFSTLLSLPNCKPFIGQLPPSAAMSSAALRSHSPASQQHPLTELNDESDFESLVSPDGYISICGFGSLLSETSARSTFPDLLNFRVARLNGFRRVFAHVAPVFFERGIAKPETMEISSLSVEPCEGETLIVTVFEIRKSEILSRGRLSFGFSLFFQKYLMANLLIFQRSFVPVTATRSFFTLDVKILAGSKEVYFQQYGRWNIDKIWRDDVFPCRVYLRHCVLAAKNLGDTAYDNFLDHTYLADRKTTIREYLATTGSGIMEEEPPEPLKYRYGG